MGSLSPREDFAVYLRKVACELKPTDDLMIIVMKEAFEAGWRAHRKALMGADSGGEACWDCGRLLDEEREPECFACGRIPGPRGDD